MEIRIGSGKTKKDGLSISKILKYFSNWWRSYYNLLFIITMFFSMGLGIYFWYLSLYVPIMTSQEVSEYRIAKDKSIIFLEEDFNHIISDLNKRSDAYSSQYTPQRDIFK